jgi:hypothetical protein
MSARPCRLTEDLPKSYLLVTECRTKRQGKLCPKSPSRHFATSDADNALPYLVLQATAIALEMRLRCLPNPISLNRSTMRMD